MGSSETKEQVAPANEINKNESPRGSRQRGKSPHLNGRQSKVNQSSRIPPVQSKFSPKDVHTQTAPKQERSRQIAQEYVREGLKNALDLALNIKIVQLNPTSNFQQLNRYESTHKGRLFSNKITKTLLMDQERFEQQMIEIHFEEKDDSDMTFVLTNQHELVDGNEDIWDIVQPFRTQEKLTKVGTLQCQSTYIRIDQQYQQDLSVDLPDSVFQRWGQHKIKGTEAIAEQFRRKRRQEQEQSVTCIEYKETSKYFDKKGNWVFTVYVEEQNGHFTSWIVEKSSGRESFSDSMAVTLVNDLQNREKAYIQEMKSNSSKIKRARSKK